jgi:hypothetical protein
VPEATRCCARPAVELVTVAVGRDFVAGVVAAALIPPVEDVVAHADVIQRVVGVVVAGDGTVGGDQRRDGAARVLEELLIVVGCADLLDALECDRGHVSVANHLVFREKRGGHPLSVSCGLLRGSGSACSAREHDKAEIGETHLAKIGTIDKENLYWKNKSRKVIPRLDEETDWTGCVDDVISSSPIEFPRYRKTFGRLLISIPAWCILQVLGSASISNLRHRRCVRF